MYRRYKILVVDAAKSESQSETESSRSELSTSKAGQVDSHKNDLQTIYEYIDELAVSLKDHPLMDCGRLKKLGLYNESEHEEDKIRTYLSKTAAADVINAFYKVLLAFLEVPNMASVTTDMEKKHAECVKKIRLLRVVVWKNTALNLAFGEKIAKTGLLEQFVEDLRNVEIDYDNETDVERTNDSTFYSALCIVLNCSKNPAVKQTLRSYNAVACLLPFLKCQSPVLKLTVLLALAYLVDEEENEMLLTDDTVFDWLLCMLRDAWENDKHKCLGYTAELLLDGFKGLAKNDKNKAVIYDKGAVPDLIVIMEEGSDKEIESAVKCIWELAFDKTIKDEMNDNDELTDALKTLKSSPNKSISKNAEGALWEISLNTRQQTDTSASTSAHSGGKEPSFAGHVMMSYQHADKEVVRKIKQSLTESRFKVWIDEDNMAGSTLAAMAKAVEEASVVLVCISERYKLSENCRSEAEYAYKLKKRIVPLIMQRNYEPDGWLGFIQGSKFFYDFSGKYPFSSKLEGLLNELGSMENQHDQSTPKINGDLQHIPSTPRKPRESIERSSLSNWSEKDVSNWLTKIGLQNRASLGNLTGDILEFLQELYSNGGL